VVKTLEVGSHQSGKSQESLLIGVMLMSIENAMLELAYTVT
jgi:hypothetical protein